MWLLLPSIMTNPAVGHQWNSVADVLKSPSSGPILLVRRVVRMVVSLLRAAFSPRTYRALVRAVIHRCQGKVLPSSPSRQLSHGRTRMLASDSSRGAESFVPRGHLAKLADRDQQAASDEQAPRFDRQHAPAAAFIQSFLRTGSLASSMQSRQNATRGIAEGAQFSQRHTWGKEGDADFRVGIVRGVTMAHEKLELRVLAVSGSALEGRDFRIVEQTVELLPGDRFASVNIELLENGVSFGAGGNAWLPVRDFVLTLSTADARAHNHKLGATQTCLVHVIDEDDW